MLVPIYWRKLSNFTVTLLFLHLPFSVSYDQIEDNIAWLHREEVSFSVVAFICAFELMADIVVYS